MQEIIIHEGEAPLDNIISTHMLELRATGRIYTIEEAGYPRTELLDHPFFPAPFEIKLDGIWIPVSRLYGNGESIIDYGVSRQIQEISERQWQSFVGKQLKVVTNLRIGPQDSTQRAYVLEII